MLHSKKGVQRSRPAHSLDKLRWLKSSRSLWLILLGLGLTAAGAVSAQTPANAPPESLTVLLEPVPPFSYEDPSGQPAGYAVELMQELLKRAGYGYKAEFNSWARIYQRAQSTPRVLVVSMARLAERETGFFWIGPTAARRVYLYRLKSRPDVQPTTLEAAKAYKIAVVREDAAERDLVAHGFELGKQLDRSPDHAAMLRKLFIQRDDLVALNSTVAAAVTGQFGYDYKQLEPVLKLSETSLFMALSRSSGEALHNQLLKAWDSMKRDGTVAATAARHPYVVLD